MLQLIKIKKNYITSNQVVQALKGVSLSFRKSEFVSILGHSGCGKTTLLNIIGGLDKYTSGDLIINGVSTKEYSDRDWDNYRNHSIGFVFQSYNLIPHQTILGNVELALTISGVNKKERKERAYSILDKVGLKGLEKKKPNQLSGGQMQRVAIARALINNPDIVLADEPTGALDSETSIQIMELLKEVAKDRLVIMVTHNPDLAYKYSSRIVKISDGEIVSDSNPFEEKITVKEKSKKKKEKMSAMSFLTATGLSFSNLLAKFKRTLLVMLASSIGIIGVSSVLAVSEGVNNYIYSMQDKMLSSYPLTIEEKSVDYSSLMGGLDASKDKTLYDFDPTTSVGIDSMINYLMSAYRDITSIKTNTIDQKLIDYINAIPSEDVAVTQYSYGIDVTNNIFCDWVIDSNTNQKETISLNGLSQRYIQELKTVDGFSDYASYVDLFTDFLKPLPDSSDYILSQYDLLGNSKMASEENEIMLVVDGDTTMTELVLAQMGFYEHDEFINIAKKAIELNKDIDYTEDQLQAISDQYKYRTSFKYEDLIGTELYYLPHDSIYSYGNVSEPVTENRSTVLLSKDSTVIYLTYTQSSDTLMGLYFDPTEGSSTQIMTLRRTSSKPENIVKPEDILEGSWSGSCMIMGNMSSMKTVSFDLSTSSNTSSVTFNKNKPTESIKQFNVGMTGSQTTNSMQGYNYNSEITDRSILDSSDCMKMKITGILRIKDGNNFGCLSRGVYYTKAFEDKYIEDASSSQMISKDTEHGFESYIGSKAEKNSCFECYVKFKYFDWSNNGVLTDGYTSALNGDMQNSFTSLFSGLTGVDYAEQDKVYLRSLSGLKAIEDSEGNYTFEKLPESISIYPTNFESKYKITDYLDKWNEDSNIIIGENTYTLEDRDELTYSDTIGFIIAIVDTLIEAITIALVAFTSLSLVVSCFMIAVITYISVMERVKEIGVIRSLGGRKKDISRLFISETLISGLASGLFGIGFTYLLAYITNLIVSSTGIGKIAILTPETAIIMCSLSVVLSVLSGLIPSMKASNQDPVIALRSE